MDIDRAMLSAASEDLAALPFPGHPDDDDLADWVLDLAELDGHVAGLALTALGASRPAAVESREVAEHAARLGRIAVTGDDSAVYDECVAYIAALQRVEDALAGRA